MLNELLKDAAIMDVNAMGGRYEASDPDGMLNFRIALDSGPMPISRVRTHGKFMWWEFRDHRGSFDMWCTYGMTGQWVVGHSTGTRYPKHAALRVNLVFKGGRRDLAFFVDPRRFGTVHFTNDTTVTGKKLSTLGPDMLTAPPDSERFVQRFVSRRLLDKQLGVVLLDQRVIAGVGNYIRAEALYRSALSPFRLIRDVKGEEFLRLREQIIQVMTESYESGGATLATFKSPDGHTGLYKDSLKVYGKECDPEGRPVKSDETADGRTIWWVPEVQV